MRIKIKGNIMAEENIRRQIDLEHLNKIPVIETKLDALVKSMDSIKIICNSMLETKTDVDWLKRFFWILATGVGTSLIMAVFAIIITR